MKHYTVMQGNAALKHTDSQAEALKVARRHLGVATTKIVDNRDHLDDTGHLLEMLMYKGKTEEAAILAMRKAGIRGI